MVGAKEGDAFHKLVEELGAVLGPSSGIDDVDTGEIISLMEKYSSCEEEWTKYALGDPSRSYTRNLVDEGNGKSNLLILVWSPGKGSAIHDHGSHCVMKVLRGKLKETVYEWPDKKLLETVGSAPPAKLRETTYHENQVTYISDQLGIHRVENPDPEKFAVSLHLYTPPNVAKNGCHIFNPKTGAPVQCKGVLYSEFGRRCKT